MYWIFIFAIIPVIVLIPFGRILVKRLILSAKIRKFCVENNLNFVGTHLLWCLGGKNGKNCDFYIESRDTVYSVKLWAMKRRHTILCFTYNGHYFIRGFVAFASGMSMGKIPVDSKFKTLPDFDFRYKFREEWYGKDYKPILLINPTCYEVRLIGRDKKESVVGRGQTVNGFYIHTLSSLLSKLYIEKSSNDFVDFIDSGNQL